MIRVSRGPEPEALQRERRHRLAQAILDRKDGRPIDFSGYNICKSELVESLNYKCIFCEMQIRPSGNPVEHFRPKAFVENEGEARDDSRYWWLAWTWENLLFACDWCNTSCKRNQFPLMPGTSPVTPLSNDLGVEQPLLIDPTRTDPREHIRFRWSEKHQRWIPYPVNGSLIGDQTIEILKMDQDDHYRWHVEDRVEPAIRELRVEMNRGDGNAVRAMWNGKMESLFAPKQPFHAITWDALDAAFPANERQRWELELPRLGAEAEPSSPSALFVDPPESAPLLAALSEDLALRVRAVSDRESAGDMQLLVADLQRLRAWTDEELSRLLGRQHQTIRGYRRTLRTELATSATQGTSDEE